MRPTIVIVHGAFADSPIWDAVIDHLLVAGHPVVAVANPLRGLAADAAYASDHVRSIDGPVVLVGHAYGGAVISNVDPDAGEIVGLVYVAGFAPLPGDTCFHLSTRHPGSTLADTVQGVLLGDGATDLTVARDRFRDQIAADVPAGRAARMAATQRPVNRQALLDPSGARPLWREIPSWFVFGEQDRTIPKAVQHFMAERARAHRTVEIPGASHAVPVAHPGTTAHLILEAAALRVAA
jgi:pimeloyl-ACP methyl ester carboxylesterase